MSLGDRLLVQSVLVETEASKDQPNIYELQRNLLTFVGLLSQSNELPAKALTHVLQIQTEMYCLIRVEFEHTYRKIFTQAAFFLLGVYKATHDLGY